MHTAVKTLTAGRKATIRASDTADLTLTDARRTYVESATTVDPVLPGRANSCIVGGAFSVPRTVTADWSTIDSGEAEQRWEQRKDRFGIRYDEGAHSPEVVGSAIHQVGDGIGIAYPRANDSSRDFLISDSRISRAEDDCIQNDRMNSGRVVGNFFDGCFVFFSARHAQVSSGAVDGRTSLVHFENNLVHLEYFPYGNEYSYRVLNPTTGQMETRTATNHYGQLFKRGNELLSDAGGDATGISPQMNFVNNMFLVDGYSEQRKNKAFDNSLPGGGSYINTALCTDAAQVNTVIWAGQGPPPLELSTLPKPCFIVVWDDPATPGDDDGLADAKAEWDRRRLAWLDAHRQPGRFVPLPSGPRRAFDTSAAGGQKLAAGQTRVFDLGSVAELPDHAHIGALAVTVRVWDPTAAADVRLWGEGAKPAISTLNVAAKEARSNSATVIPGAAALNPARVAVTQRWDESELRLAISSGESHVAVDVVGYYEWSSARGATAFAPLRRPIRLTDSRQPVSSINPLSGKWGPGQTRTLQVEEAVRDGVTLPATIDAVVLNVTADGGTPAVPGATSDIRVGSGGAAEQQAAWSSLVWNAAPPTATLVIAKLDADGRVHIKNTAGSVHLMVDVIGTFVPMSATDSGGGLSPTAPTRLYDSRSADLFWGTGGDTKTVPIGLPVPGDAHAAALNVTAVSRATSVGGWLKVWPSGAETADIPSVSNLNWTPSYTVPAPAVANQVLVGLAPPASRTAPPTIQVRNAKDSSTYVVVDAAGYFRPLVPAWGPPG